MPSSVSVDGDQVTLTLATAVTATQTVTVSYTPPANNPLQDEAGADAASFTDETVSYGSDDATLSALELENTSSGAEISLSPTFAAATLSYTANVTSGVSVVTVKATVNDSLASIRYLDDSDSVISDYLNNKARLTGSLE